MHADRCIARGATNSSRLKVHRVLHTHAGPWTRVFFFPLTLQLSILPPPPATSYCLRRSDILLTAQLLDSLTVSVSSRSTHLLPSAVICYMQPSFTLVATCPFCLTEVAPAVIIPRWSLTNGRMDEWQILREHCLISFFHVEEISYDLNSYATFSELVVI